MDPGVVVRAACGTPYCCGLVSPRMAFAAARRCLHRYREIVRALEPGVDLYICETMSSAMEARVAATVRNPIIHPLRLRFASWRAGVGWLRRD